MYSHGTHIGCGAWIAQSGNMRFFPELEGWRELQKFDDIVLKWLGETEEWSLMLNAYDNAVINVEFCKTPVEVYRVDEDDRESRRR